MEFMKREIDGALKMNLQEFAEEDTTSNDKDSGEGADEKKSDKNSDKKLEMTEAEYEKKVEAEADRKLESALKKKRSEWQKEMDKKIQDAIEEKERLSKLSEKERKEEQLSKREKELADRLAELERKELRADAVGDLREKGLPVEFADTLLGENAEKTLENINAFKKAFDEAVNDAVKGKLRQDTPSAGASKGSDNKIQSIAEMRNKQDKPVENAPNPWA